MFGILIGSFIGSLFWVLLGYLGYFSSIGGLAIAYCAYKGFILLKGPYRRIIPVFFILISFISVINAEIIVTLINIYRYALSNNIRIEFIDSLIYLLRSLTNWENSKAIYFNILLGILFSSSGLLLFMHGLANKSKKLVISILD